MPIFTSDFSPSFLFKNGHFSTIYRSIFIKESNESYQRKRIDTWDGDFIDLDFSTIGSNTLALLIHGLEGSAESTYILALKNELNKEGIDTVSFNLRGCSGEDNLLIETYHSGKTEDLDFVIKHLLDNYTYDNIVIVGYSLGGNMTLKYMGEYAQKVHPKVKGAIAVSVPCDLATSGKVLARTQNRLYMYKFLTSLRLKITRKLEKFPSYQIDKKALKEAKNFKDFDGLYTAPTFGFKDAEDYWEKASAKPYLPKITKPTLLLTSLDDPFLSKECFPNQEATASEHFYLEVTKHGGHVGFISSFRSHKNRWLEHRIIRFVHENILRT